MTINVTGTLLRLPGVEFHTDSFGRENASRIVKYIYRTPIECELVGRRKKSGRLAVRYIDSKGQVRTELVKERYYIPTPISSSP